jgi:hypothetical protein
MTSVTPFWAEENYEGYPPDPSAAVGDSRKEGFCEYCTEYRLMWFAKRDNAVWRRLCTACLKARKNRFRFAEAWTGQKTSIDQADERRVLRRREHYG